MRASSRARIDAEVLAWMRDAEPALDADRFDTLAVTLFAHQFASCAPFRRFCEGRGATPQTARTAGDVPAVPAGAFKELRLACFPEAETRHVFRTSGTSAARRGRLELDTLELYEASLVSSFERHVLPELSRAGERARIVVLAPPREEAPDSSLSHMFAVMLDRRGDEGSGCFVGGDALHVDAALEALVSASTDRPLLLCGTAFSLVHLVEALHSRGERLTLPPATRVMETGGFKGRARERPRDVLYTEIEDSLGVPAARIVNQYGMTELGSQFYDSVLSRPGEPRRKLGPPWARVRIVEPESGRECPPGEPGAIRIHDLANTGSIACIQTADLGRTLADGFEVLGREPGAEERGCSIALDEMLGGGGSD